MEKGENRSMDMASLPPVLPKHARLRQDLLQRIRQGRYTSGDEFVTEHELIRHYKVSSTTARRCLNDLTRDGLLVRRRGSGTYISEWAMLRAKRAFGIVCSSFSASLHTPYYGLMMTGLERHIRDLDWRIGLITTQGLESTPKPGLALAEMARQHADNGLFIISPLPEVWVQDLYDSGLPLVSINVDFPNVPLARILTDTSQAIRCAFNHLFNLGHRRITFVLGQTPGFEVSIPSGAQFAELELQKIRAEQGSTVSLPSVVYPYGDCATQKVILAPLFTAAAAERPTAVVMFENSVARVVEDMARAVGWTLPGELSILTLQAPSPYLSYTAVEPQMENLCWRAVRIMEGLLDGHPPAHVRDVVRCELVVRQSTTLPVN